jgi:hypothetical protein
MSIKKYTKKPVTIEALQWTGENVSEIFEFCSMSYRAVINPETGEMGMIISSKASKVNSILVSQIFLY